MHHLDLENTVFEKLLGYIAEKVDNFKKHQREEKTVPNKDKPLTVLDLLFAACKSVFSQ